MVRVVPLSSKRELERFLELPYRLHRNLPNWIPPLRLERRHFFTQNPYFRHARWRGWLALREGKVVGRITAQIDELYLSVQRERCGFFGFLEAVDDREVFAALLEAAASWLREEGMAVMRGPFHFSINQESGLLVEGFSDPPCLMMPYHPPYYRERLESLGLKKVQELLAYRIDQTAPFPEGAARLAEKAAELVSIRTLNRRRLPEELETIRELFNDAWRENWGFVPLTREEVVEIGRQLRLFVPDDFVLIAEIGGEPVGMVVAVPDLNRLIGDLGGRLFPLGWLKLFYRLNFSPPDRGRVVLMGIRREVQQNPFLSAGIGALLISRLREAALRYGLREMELSWILEGNRRVRQLIEGMGGIPYKRYRIYQLPLRPEREA